MGPGSLWSAAWLSPTPSPCCVTDPDCWKCASGPSPPSWCVTPRGPGCLNRWQTPTLPGWPSISTPWWTWPRWACVLSSITGHPRTWNGPSPTGRCGFCSHAPSPPWPQRWGWQPVTRRLMVTPMHPDPTTQPVAPTRRPTVDRPRLWCRGWARRRGWWLGRCAFWSLQPTGPSCSTARFLWPP